MLNKRLSAPFRGDANDVLYQWDSSRDDNASPGLERIQAMLLAINSADDECNPPELGLLDREIKHVKNSRVLLIPGSDQTVGHGTTVRAKFWKQSLAELLQSAPRRAKSSRWAGRRGGDFLDDAQASHTRKLASGFAIPYPWPNTKLAP